MLESSGTLLILALLCLTRPLTVLRVAPIFGSTVMPPQALTGFGMALTLLFFPVALAGAPESVEFSWMLLPLIIKELIIGLIIGFVLGILFWAAQSFGMLIDNQRGASSAQSQDPLGGDQSTPFGSLFFQVTAMLFLASGGFASLVGIIAESYAIWPVFAPLPKLTSNALYNLLLLQADLVMRLAVMLCAPMP